MCCLYGQEECVCSTAAVLGVVGVGCFCCHVGLCDDESNGVGTLCVMLSGIRWSEMGWSEMEVDEQQLALLWCNRSSSSLVG